MTIALPPEIETRLKGEALRHGLAAEEYATKLIVEHLPPVPNTASIAELFARWEAEDHTDDPEEIEQRNQEAEEFIQTLNRNRIEMEGPGTRRLIP